MREWIYSETYLSKEEMKNNASIVYGFFGAKSWNINSISAITANMQSESTINPHLTEVDGYGGYGLVQWTPKSDLINACSILGLSPYDDGNIQLEVIDAEMNNRGGVQMQWYTTEAFISPYYPSGATPDMIGITTQDFISNPMNWSAEKLTILFMSAYERPSYDPETNHSGQRQENARNWYKYFTGVEPPVPPQLKNKMPIWMKIRYR